MLDNQPSRTALTAAAARAAHLIVDNEPVIFADTLAKEILGDRAEELISAHRDSATHPVQAGARTEVTCRSRFTEERVSAAVSRGVSQYVILGAGLDSFAYRSGRAVRVFEVDHPATQDIKQWLLRRARIPVPGNLAFVATDFADPASVVSLLVSAGLDRDRPAVVSWLGVIVYLPAAAITDTAAAIGALAPGTELIADYLLPAHLRDEAARDFAGQVGANAGAKGEPWLSFLAPEDLTAVLRSGGFGDIRHVPQRAAIPGQLWNRTDALRPMSLSCLVHATVAPRGTGSRPARDEPAPRVGALRE